MQLIVDFQMGMTRQFPEFADVIKHVVYACGRPLKAIAADMDLSQSELSRRLADNPNDPRNMRADELPALIEACEEKVLDVVYWLVEKYLENPERRKERAKDALVQMAPAFLALMREALPQDIAEGVDGQYTGPQSVDATWKAI